MKSYIKRIINSYTKQRLVKDKHLNNELHDLLCKIRLNQKITFNELRDSFIPIKNFFQNEKQTATYEQIIAFLTHYSLKELSVNEIAALCAGTKDYLINNMKTSKPNSIATAGSGGDTLKTVNISSPASIITASCNIPSIKHGAGRVSGISGSSDWFKENKINYQIDNKKMLTILEKIKIGFFELVQYNLFGITIFRVLIPGSIFEILGPMIDPVNTTYKVIGAKDLNQQKKIAEAFLRLKKRGYFKNLKRIDIPCGADENDNFLIDEVSIIGKTKIISIKGDTQESFTINPNDFGIKNKYKYSQIKMQKEKKKNIQASTNSLKKKIDPKLKAIQDMLLINSAHHLVVAKKHNDYKSAYLEAKAKIQNGDTFKTLEKFRLLTSKK